MLHINIMQGQRFFFITHECYPHVPKPPGQQGQNGVDA
jgi:hypothetical protein